MVKKMAQEGKISITIDRKIWEKLVKLKIKMKFRTFDEVLNQILKGGVNGNGRVRN
jgi:hypothetical protein